MGTVGRFLRDNWQVLLIVGGMAAAWLLLRTPDSGISSAEEFDQRVSAGRPVLVEFYSNT